MTVLAEGAPPRAQTVVRRQAAPALLLLPALIWITVFFLLPLALMCWRSLAAEGYSLNAYWIVLSSPLYTKVMLTTLETASIATVLALFVAYPMAYTLTITSGILRGLLLMFVFIPYWVDIIVRTFSWLILLGDHGLINALLRNLGLVHASLPLLYSEFAVLVGMVQILLPLTIVILFGAMLRIDRTLIAAAKIHGASSWNAFRTVFFPLSLPGVYGAALLVFVLSLGFYVTPALLGSPRQTMIAQTIMVEASELLDWGQASAAGFLLLILTTLIAAIYNRYFSLDRLWGGSDA